MTLKDRRSPARTIVLWIGVAIFVATWAVYAPVGHHEFVTYDDPAYITDNPRVAQGLSWSGTWWAFQFNLHAHNWHPLTWLSHMLDSELFGLHAGRHHQVSVALHGLNALLLLAALFVMTRAPWPSAFVAAVFALHPLRVESVAWAAERKDVLAGSFWMLALLAYARYARKPTPRGYLVVVSAVLLGLMAKPMLVSLPFVLLLLDLWPLRRWRPFGTAASGEPFGRLVIEKLPLLALAVASSVVTLHVQDASGAVRSGDVIPFTARLANASVAYLAYLKNTVWPAGLAVFYPHPALLAEGASRVPAVLGAGLMLAGVTALAVRWMERRPYVFVGWAWFLGTLVPVIGLVQVGEQAYADRYAYLPLVGIYIACAWWVRELPASRPASRNAIRVVAAALVLGCAALTWMQVGHWRNSRALYERALAVTRNNYLAHNNLGNLYYRQGDLDLAKPHYEAALRARPGYADANYNLGNVLLHQGDSAMARVLFERALETQPTHAMANLNLGVVCARSGDAQRALLHFERAARAEPGNPEPLFNIGVVYASLQRPREAQLYLERALRLDPEHQGALSQLRRLPETQIAPR